MKPYVSRPSSIIRRISPVAAVVLAACFLAGGCVCRVGSPPEINRLVLDYSLSNAVSVRGGPFEGETITVSRFSASEECRGTTMLYSFSSGERSPYHYHRWYTSLPVMVTEWIINDISRAGLFHAVFSEQTYEKTRFYLEGRVTSCIEVREGDRRKVVFGFTAALIDEVETAPSERIVFQKDYYDERYLERPDPAGLTKAMSESMAVLSEELLRDVALHVEDRRKSSGM